MYFVSKLLVVLAIFIWVLLKPNSVKSLVLLKPYKRHNLSILKRVLSILFRMDTVIGNNFQT